MKVREFTEKLEEAVEKLDFYENSFYGLRFEEKEREVGDVCENTKHNRGREDERDFPEYGTAEYDNMPELDGASAWHIDEYSEELVTDKLADAYCHDKYSDKELLTTSHAYIIGGDVECTHDDCDYNEIVIADAKVIVKLF